MKNKFLWLIVSFAFIVRLFYLFDDHLLYWDGAVYIGMAKFIFSWGSVGIWEHIRPLIWPLILGVIWTLRLPVIFSGQIIQLFFSLGIIVLVYLIGKKAWNYKVGLLAASIMAFSSAFLFYGFRLLTEIPAAFFALLAIYLYLSDRPFSAGLFASFSFLTKFPFGIFLVVIIVADLKRPKVWSRFLGGFLTPTAIYLLMNQWWYGGALIPLLDASSVINLNYGCNVLYAQPWYIYFLKVPFDSPFMVLSLGGIYFSFRRWDMPNRLILMASGFPIAYLLQLSCKDFRFAILYTPFLAVLAGVFLSRMLRYPIKRWPQILPIAIILILGISGLGAVLQYNVSEPEPFTSERVAFYSAYMGDLIYSTSPWPAAYQDVLVEGLYYPNFDAPTAERYTELINSGDVDVLFLDGCGGGLECNPSDTLCVDSRDDLYNTIFANMTKIRSFEGTGCTSSIYTLER